MTPARLGDPRGDAGATPVRRDGDRVDALVVGAGPAGLATSRELSRRGVSHRILEKGDVAGHVWAHLYDSLTLHTGRHMSHLPGRRFPAGTPLFPPRATFVEYLQAYARALGVPVETGVDVMRLARDGAEWVATTTAGDIRTRAVVLATGIVSNPRRPGLPGTDAFRGALMHSSSYRRPAPFAGQRVLVIGVGNSGGEIASELAHHGARVTVAVRSGANVVPREIAGIPVQYLSFLLRKLPRAAQRRVAAWVQRMGERRRGPPVLPRPAHSALDAIPLIGFNLVDAIREGLVAVRPGIERITEHGVRFTDGREEAFDTIIAATGFRAAVQPLGDLVRLDERGFGNRTDRVVSADQPNLFYVGHNYDSTGGLKNIARDAPLAAAQVVKALQ